MSRNRNTHRSTMRAALAILCLAVALCGFAAAPSSAQSPPVKIRINKIPIAPYVPVEVALSRGWFKDAGLDVSIDTVAAGAVAIQAMAGGKLDIIYTSLDIGLRAYTQGFDVVILSNQNNAQLKSPDAAAILVRNDIGIATLKDLEGKRFLVNNLQNVNWAYSREAISKAGGDPARVQFLELQFPQMVDALLGGQADAAATTEPFSTIGVGTGKLTALAYPFTDVQPGLNIAGWVASGAWVKARPKEAVAFRNVIQKAMDLLENNPEEKTKAILQFTPLKADLLSRITLDKWTTKIDPEDLQKQLDIYRKQGLIDKTYDVKTIIVP
jgi:NitT/TauT family transport system substrate-binding protein